MKILRSTVTALIGATAIAACASDEGTAVPAATGGAIGSGGCPLPSSGGAASGGFAPSTGGQPPASGGASGGRSSSGGADAGEEAGPGEDDTPPCVTDGTQVAIIGDAFANWISHTFGADLNTLSSLTIENFAVNGASLGSGGSAKIAPQFDAAIAKHATLNTIVMTGGGTDFFTPDTVQFPMGGNCRNLGARAKDTPDCLKIIDKAVEGATALFEKMAKSGVKEVVYFYYPKIPTNTIIGGNSPNGMLDMAMPKLRAACESSPKLAVEDGAPMRCHFVEIVPVFDGHPEFFSLGDIHPTPAGSKAIATAVWERMKQECVGQPAASGCCKP